jgi:hypothetical protein
MKVPPNLAGSDVRCPHCRAIVRAPEVPVAAAVDTGGPSAANIQPPTQPHSIRTPPSVRGAGGRRYGFNCQYCSSRLEANEGMAGTTGGCPTCGNTITIPILDRFGRLIDPMTGMVIKQDPHPVHAYAAAGDRAPRIFRRSDGSQAIQCPRCPTVSPIQANNCKQCGMPFTMEGTTAESAGQSNGFAVASLVLGLVGLPTSCLMVLPLLAVVFGSIALYQTRESGSGRGIAIAGITCGVIGLGMGLLMILN